MFGIDVCAKFVKQIHSQSSFLWLSHKIMCLRTYFLVTILNVLSCFIALWAKLHEFVFTFFGNSPSLVTRFGESLRDPSYDCQTCIEMIPPETTRRRTRWPAAQETIAAWQPCWQEYSCFELEMWSHVSVSLRRQNTGILNDGSFWFPF